jgi:hypothetical protein
LRVLLSLSPRSPPAARATISTTRLNAYRRNGVREYVVWRVWDRAVDWFVLREVRFVPLPAGEDGIYRSEVFPGLWLDAAAVVSGNIARVLDVLQGGLASDGHSAFVRKLQEMASK